MKTRTPGTLRQYQAGIGMIEIILTIFLVAIAVLGLAQMALETSTGAGEAKARAEALNIAEKKLEELRDFSTFSTFDTQVTDLDTPETLDGTNASYTITWDVDDYPDPLDADDPGLSYRDITVSVTWVDKEQEKVDGVYQQKVKRVDLHGRIVDEEPVKAGSKLLVLAKGPTPNLPIDLEDDEEPCEGEGCDEEPPCVGDECDVEPPCVGDECDVEPPCVGDECEQEEEPCAGLSCDWVEVHLYGSISVANSTSVDSVYVTASGDHTAVYCDKTPSAYDCTIETLATWSGSLVVVTSNNDYACGMTSSDGLIWTKAFTNLTEEAPQVFDIKIIKSNQAPGGC